MSPPSPELTDRTNAAIGDSTTPRVGGRGLGIGSLVPMPLAGRTPNQARRAVFVDGSGRRMIIGRVLGVGVGAVVVAYLVAFGFSLLGVSWVPPVDLPVVGDLLPSEDAGTQAPKRSHRGDEALD